MVYALAAELPRVAIVIRILRKRGGLATVAEFDDRQILRQTAPSGELHLAGALADQAIVADQRVRLDRNHGVGASVILGIQFQYTEGLDDGRF